MLTEEEYDLNIQREWEEYQASQRTDELLDMCERYLCLIEGETDEDARAQLIYEAHDFCYEYDLDSTWIPA